MIGLVTSEFSMNMIKIFERIAHCLPLHVFKCMHKSISHAHMLQQQCIDTAICVFTGVVYALFKGKGTFTVSTVLFQQRCYTRCSLDTDILHSTQIPLRLRHKPLHTILIIKSKKCERLIKHLIGANIYTIVVHIMQWLVR